MDNHEKVLLYGRFNSVNVQKVIWVCEELKIPYDRIDAGGAFELNSKNPEYLKLNPNGLIPTINDNVRKFGKDSHDWYPTNNLQRCAEIDRWFDATLLLLILLQVRLDNQYAPLFLGIIRTPKEQRNEAQLKINYEKALKDWKMLNEHLKHQDYMAGENLTIADLAIFIWVWRWNNLPEIEKPSFPALDAYFERVKKNQHAAMFMTPLS